MAYIINNPWVMWMILSIFFLIIELMTVSLVSIWFVVAAIITAILSVFIESYIWQIAIFLSLSGVFMILFRNLYKNHLKSNEAKIGVNDQLLGKTAVTVEDTDGTDGKVLVGDVYWRAVSEFENKIEKGERVVITGVGTTTLIIKKENHSK